MKEIRSLTGLRGIAALWVFFVHSGIVAPHGFFEKMPQIRNFFAFGTVSVDLFFLLSGYLLMATNNYKFEKLRRIDYCGFMIKRIARIYPLYAILLFLAILFYNPVIPEIGYNKSIITCVSNFLLIQSPLRINCIIGPSWSLSYEWLLYFLFPIIAYILLKYYKYLISIFILLTIFYLFGTALAEDGSIMNVGGNSIMQIRGLSGFIRAFFSFTLGMLLNLNSSRFNSLHKWSLLFILCLVISAVNLVYILAVCLLNPLILLSLKDDKGFVARFFSQKIIYNLGLYSYGFYLLHPFFLDIVKEPLNLLIKDLPYISHVAYPMTIIILLFLIYQTSKYFYFYIEIKGKQFLLKGLNK